MNMVTIQVKLPTDQVRELLEIAESEQLSPDLCIKRAIQVYHKLVSGSHELMVTEHDSE